MYCHGNTHGVALRMRKSLFNVKQWHLSIPADSRTVAGLLRNVIVNAFVSARVQIMTLGKFTTVSSVTKTQ